MHYQETRGSQEEKKKKRREARIKIDTKSGATKTGDIMHGLRRLGWPGSCLENIRSENTYYKCSEGVNIEKSLNVIPSETVRFQSELQPALTWGMVFTKFIHVWLGTIQTLY